MVTKLKQLLTTPYPYTMEVTIPTIEQTANRYCEIYDMA